MTAVWLLAATALAQPPAPDGATAGGTGYSSEQLAQMLAPIALYADDLLSQVLMAATYPIEIVEAERWQKANAALQGDAAGQALEAQPWDPSVKSLVNFPDVLEMLSAQLAWTQDLGNAFLGPPQDVFAAIQDLRAKAQAVGTLQTSPEQVVTTEPSGADQVIVIQPASPDIIYVPTYDPTVVYGTWSYPSSPPYAYYPPRHVLPAAGRAMAFGAGVAAGAAWGYAWGHVDWHDRDIDVDIDRNVHRNVHIDHHHYAAHVEAHTAHGSWTHDGSHRGNVPYVDAHVAHHYGGQSTAEVAHHRAAYRGYGDAAQGGYGRGNAPTQLPAGGGARPAHQPAYGQQPGARPTQLPAHGGQPAARPAQQPAHGRQPAAGTQPTGGHIAPSQRPAQATATQRSAPSHQAHPTSGSSAFAGSRDSGQAARAQSSRGHQSQGSRSASGGGRSSQGSRGGGGRRGR